jgi:DNA-binding transcriptional LysR family regulator
VLDWDDMRVFLAIHRGRTLAAAGSALKINATTAGRRLATLEERAGAKLFDRTPDGYIVTPAGRDLVASAERIEAEVQRVERQIVGADRRPAGVVRVALTEMLATRLVAKGLPRFRDRYPDITLELACSNRRVNLARREADIALRLSTPREPGVIVKKLGKIHLALYAAKDYLAARGVTRDPEESIRGLHAILFTDSHAFARENDWFKERLDGAPIVLRSDSISSVFAACVAGLGVALLPRAVADPEPALQRLETTSSPEPRIVFQLVHEDLADSARIRAVRDFLAETLSEPPGRG